MDGKDAANEALISQMRKGAIEYCVLALMRERERYGFELVQTLSEYEGMITTEGTIYPLLTRLRKDGRVETTWIESDSGPPRRYYRLTQEGRDALNRFSQEWSKFREAVDAVLKQPG